MRGTLSPQAGCPSSERESFFEDLEGLLETIPSDERKFILADLNGHVGETNADYASVHGGFGYGSMNGEGRNILEFAAARNLSIVNPFFAKKTRHLVTYSSGNRTTQIDFILCDQDMRKYFKDCKVIIGEAVISQHRLLLGELELPVTLKRKDTSTFIPKIKWHRLKEESACDFIENVQDTLIESLNNDSLEVTPNQMYDDFQRFCLELAKSKFGVTKGKLKNDRETWWWNETVQKVVAEKKVCFKCWKVAEEDPSISVDEVSNLRKKYKDAKKN